MACHFFKERRISKSDLLVFECGVIPNDAKKLFPVTF